MYRKEYDINTYPKWIWEVSSYCNFEGLNWAQRKAVRKEKFKYPNAWLSFINDRKESQSDRRRWKEEKRFYKKLYRKCRGWKRNELKSRARQAVRQMLGDDELDEGFETVVFESNSKKQFTGYLD